MSTCLPHILKSSKLGKQLGLTKDTAFNTIAEIRELIDSNNQNKEIKPKIDSSKKIESLKRGDIINFQQQEFLVERVKNEGIDVRDVNTGDVDFISTEDYINETQEQPIIEETKENFNNLSEYTNEEKKKILTTFASKYNISEQQALDDINKALKADKQGTIDNLNECF